MKNRIFFSSLFYHRGQSKNIIGRIKMFAKRFNDSFFRIQKNIHKIQCASFNKFVLNIALKRFFFFAILFIRLKCLWFRNPNFDAASVSGNAPRLQYVLFRRTRQKPSEKNNNKHLTPCIKIKIF